MSIERAIVEMIPSLVDWIQARLGAGESIDEIRRDIKDRTQKIADNRRKRDTEFNIKFGEPFDGE